MRKLIRLLGLCVFLFILIGCSGTPESTNQPTAPTTSPSLSPSSTVLPPTAKPPSASASAFASPSASPASSAYVCPVTLPNGSAPPDQNPSPLFYGNNALWTSLWSEGKVVFGPSGPGKIGADGSLSIQWPWWRGVQGTLVLDGKRMDASAPPLRAIVPNSFGQTGFQPTTLVFSSEGCWQVTGKVGSSSLTFVTLVVKTK